MGDGISADHVYRLFAIQAVQLQMAREAAAKSAVEADGLRAELENARAVSNAQADEIARLQMRLGSQSPCCPATVEG